MGRNYEINKSILEGLKRRKTRQRIADELGISVESVAYRIKSMRDRGVMIPKTKKRKVSKIKKSNRREEKNLYMDNKISELLAEGKKQIEIAKDLGVSSSCISIRIKKMRERGIVITKPVKEKVKHEGRVIIIKIKNDETDDIILKGLAEGKTQTEISEELDLSKQSISQRIKKMRERGVQIPDSKKRESNYDINDKRILEGLAENKTLDEIADILGIKRETVKFHLYRMRVRGIEIPNVTKHDGVKIENDELDDKILQEIQNNKIPVKIAKKLGISIATVYKRINRMRARGIAIPVHKRSSIRKVEDIDQKILDGINSNKSYSVIAKELGVKRYTISNRISRMREIGVDIPIRKNVQAIKKDNTIIETETREEKLARMIVNLMDTKDATIVQVREMGRYYKVADYVERILLNRINNFEQEEIEI